MTWSGENPYNTIFTGGVQNVTLQQQQHTFFCFGIYDRSKDHITKYFILFTDLCLLHQIRIHYFMQVRCWRTSKQAYFIKQRSAQKGAVTYSSQSEIALHFSDINVKIWLAGVFFFFFSLYSFLFAISYPVSLQVPYECGKPKFYNLYLCVCVLRMTYPFKKMP